jgi:hypothetical protein
MPEGFAGESSDVDPERQAERDIWDVLRAGAAQESAELPEELRHLDEKHRAQEIRLKGELVAQELQLRRNYARGLLAILAVQLVIADAVFVAFAWAGEQWHLTTGVIDVWLATVVVEVVGVVHVVTRHLFPQRDG